MICPECGTEYPEGVTSCERCGATLAGRAQDARQADEEPEWVDLVTVMKSGDEAELTVAKSLLEAEGIPCLLKDEGVQDIVGFGRIGGENVATGPVEVQVRREHAQAARELLSAKGHRLHMPEGEGPEVA